MTTPKKPTYTAKEVKAMCQNLEVDYNTIKVLVELVEEEIDLYSEGDLIVITQASMILFNRSLLNGALKFIKQ